MPILSRFNAPKLLRSVNNRPHASEDDHEDAPRKANREGRSGPQTKSDADVDMDVLANPISSSDGEEGAVGRPPPPPPSTSRRRNEALPTASVSQGSNASAWKGKRGKGKGKAMRAPQRGTFRAGIEHKDSLGEEKENSQEAGEEMDTVYFGMGDTPKKKVKTKNVHAAPVGFNKKLFGKSKRRRISRPTVQDAVLTVIQRVTHSPYQRPATSSTSTTSTTPSATSSTTTRSTSRCPTTMTSLRPRRNAGARYSGCHLAMVYRPTPRPKTPKPVFLALLSHRRSVRAQYNVCHRATQRPRIPRPKTPKPAPPVPPSHPYHPTSETTITPPPIPSHSLPNQSQTPNVLYARTPSTPPNSATSGPPIPPTPSATKCSSAKRTSGPKRSARTQRAASQR
ncbi:hypothetical protein PMIN06_010003 [Paraphaeosphaeria minitans]